MVGSFPRAPFRACGGASAEGEAWQSQWLNDGASAVDWDRSGRVRRWWATASSRCRWRSSCSSSSLDRLRLHPSATTGTADLQRAVCRLGQLQERCDGVFWSHAVPCNTLVYTVTVVHSADSSRSCARSRRQPEQSGSRTFFRAARSASVACSVGGGRGDRDAHPRFRRLASSPSSTISAITTSNAWFAQESTALPAIIGLNAWTASRHDHDLLPRRPAGDTH